ncbi:MAG: DUF4339 domain-containing protein [Muribaculaceae bacterium]|nr:DUF4339 domain-containing protein [Muribaculaceae bacterium]
MKQYYISKGGEAVGPMAPEMLGQYGLKPSSLVWCKDMKNWLPASQVPELAQYLAAATPPPAPLQQQYDPQQTKSIHQPQPQPLSSSSTDDDLQTTTSQKICRGFLYFFVVLIMLFGIGMFLGSLIVYLGYNVSDDIHSSVSSSKIHTSFALLLTSTMLITLISIISLVRLIKGHRYGFITFGLFFVCSLYVLIAKFRGISTIFSKAVRHYDDFHEVRDLYDTIVNGLVIFGLIGLILSFFAAIPAEKLVSGKRYKALISETPTSDCIIIVLFFATIILLHIFAPIFEFLIK